MSHPRPIRLASRAAWLLLLWVGSTAALFRGCDGLFRPATPEAPEGGSNIVIPLVYGPEPDDVLDTMAQAIAAKNHGNGQEAYIGAFSDGTLGAESFTATFDNEVANRHEQAGREVPLWTLALERNFYNFFSELRSENYLLRWSVNEVRGNDEIGDGEALLYRKYQVFVVGEDGTTRGTIAIGTADLHVSEVTPGRWAIVLWEDGVDPAVGVDPDDPEQVSFSKRRLDTQ